MTKVVTLAQRKMREVLRRRGAADAVMAELQAFAGAQGGRFVVFGSVAQQRVSFDSDFDVMIDFPAIRENAAIEFVEDICRKQNLPVDIVLKSQASDRFLARISDHAVTIS
jgi:predicted nucleotidyltransferase